MTQLSIMTIVQKYDTMNNQYGHILEFPNYAA